MQRLLEESANVQETRAGASALHAASVHGHNAIVDLLLDKDAAITAKTPAGDTPLLLSAIHGHDMIVQALLAQGGGGLFLMSEVPL